MFTLLSDKNDSRPNRRSVLAGIVAAPALVVSAQVEAHEHAIPENPELVRLGDELPRIAAEFVAARDAEREVRREAARIWPSPPQQIVIYSGGEIERDIAGAGISKKGCSGSVHLGTPAYFADRADWYQKLLSRGRKAGSAVLQNELKTSLRAEVLSAAYFAECDRIRELLSYNAYARGLSDALQALRELVKDIMGQSDTSVAGLEIKAQALQGWGEVDPFYRFVNVDGAEWPQRLAESVLKHCARGATFPNGDSA